MLRLFKRKKDSRPSMMGTVWLKWADGFNGRLHKWAVFLTNWTNRYSVRTKKIWLIAICVVSAAGYVNIGINAFSKSEGVRHIDKIAVPEHVPQSKRAKSQPAKQHNHPSMNNIRRFNRYMDSLQKTESGKKTYDSILLVRPGLLDSVKQAEMMSSKE